MPDKSENEADLYEMYVPDPCVHPYGHNPHAQYSVHDACINQTYDDYYLLLLRCENPTYVYPTFPVNFAIPIVIIRAKAFLCKKKEPARQTLFVTSMDDIPLCNTLSFVT